MEGQRSQQLVHPVYLDVPMMVSFLATIENGVAYGGESTRKVVAREERDREAAARVGLPAFVSLLGIDMRGRLAQKAEGEESEETKVVRRHTEASLFNLLRERLIAEEAIETLESADQLPQLDTGRLVEVTGEVLGNPLEQMLDLVRQMLPYFGMDEDALRAPKKPPGQAKAIKGGKRSGNPAMQAAARAAEAGEQAESEAFDPETVFRMLLTMREDLESATVRDLLIEGPDGIRAVLGLSTEFYDRATSDQLLAGRFTALGKTTRVLAEGEALNLTRRTVLGVAGPELARSTVTSAREAGVFMELADPVVESPAAQIFPLAVFV